MSTRRGSQRRRVVRGAFAAVLGSCVASPGVAQDALAVMPGWAEERLSGRSVIWPFAPAGRSQQQWARVATGRERRTIGVLLYRFAFDGRTPELSAVDGLRVTLGHARHAIGAMSATFAENHGRGTARCFTGTIDVPERSHTTDPLVFEVRIVLERPFVFDPQHGDLIVDIVRQPSRRDSGIAVEAFSGGAAGSGVRLGTGGRLIDGARLQLELDGDRGAIVPGGRLQLVASGLTMPRATLLGIGRDEDAWVGLRLPFGHGAAGHWFVPAPVWRGMAMYSLGSGRWEARVVVGVPAVDGLPGRQARVQAVHVDAAVNAVGLVFSDALRVEIGAGTELARLLVDGSPQADTGAFVFAGQGGGGVVMATLRPPYGWR